MALVSGISLDPEAAIGVTKKLPPKWVDGVDEVSLESLSVSLQNVKKKKKISPKLSSQIQYEITRIQQKMKDLALLHDKHMNRPTLDDSSEEEHAIEITTQEITQVRFTVHFINGQLYF